MAKQEGRSGKKPPPVRNGQTGRVPGLRTGSRVKPQIGITRGEFVNDVTKGKYPSHTVRAVETPQAVDDQREFQPRIRETLARIDQIRAEMQAEQPEIDALRAETRELLAKLDAA